MEEDSRPGTPFHLGAMIYLYPHTPHFIDTFDPAYFHVSIESLRKNLGQITMAEQPSTSQTVSSDAASVESSVTTSSMFSTTLESHLYGEPSILVGYQYLFGTHLGVFSTQWSSPMSSTRILPGSSLTGTQQFDPVYQYQARKSGQQRPMYPLNN